MKRREFFGMTGAAGVASVLPAEAGQVQALEMFAEFSYDGGTSWQRLEDTGPVNPGAEFKVRVRVENAK